LQAWIRTYGKMITAISWRQQQIKQQGQMGIAEAVDRLYNIQSPSLHTYSKNSLRLCALFPMWWFWAHSDPLAAFGVRQNQDWLTLL
jgi:hypothetical protein